MITAVFVVVYTNGINQINEDRLLDRARLLIQPFSEQAASFISLKRESELQSLVQNTVRGSVIYAQVVEDGLMLAKSSSGMGLKVLPHVEQPPATLAINEMEHPVGTRYMDLIQPFIRSQENASSGYVRLGIDISQFEEKISSGILSALVLALIVFGSVAILGSTLIIKWQPAADSSITPTSSEESRDPATPAIEAGVIKIDDSKKEVSIADQEVRLSQKEYELLRLLASEPGRVFSPQEIIEVIWPDNTMSTEDVKKYIYLLRQKIEPDSPEPEIIVNVKGFGYRLAV